VNLHDRRRTDINPIKPAAAYFCKRPPEQMPDEEAFEALKRFILE
jgi:myo-inositol-1-phosphate synthase